MNHDRLPAVQHASKHDGTHANKAEAVRRALRQTYGQGGEQT